MPIRKPDVRDVTMHVDELKPEVHDAAVCTVLRWAARTKTGPLIAFEICETLGLNIDAASTRTKGPHNDRY